MKKIMALVLALVMIIPLVLTACDNGDKPSDLPSNNNTGDGATTTAGGNSTTAPSGNDNPDAPYVYTPDPDGKHPGKVGIGSKGASVTFQTLTATDTANKTDVLSNDFSAENPTEGWTFVGGEASDFVVEPEEEGSETKVMNVSKEGAMAVFGESVWNNIQYAVRMKIHEVGNGAVIYFCVKDEQNYIEVIVGDENGTYITVNNVENGTATQLGRAPYSIVGIELDTRFSVSVTVRKDVIDVYVAGTHLFQLFGEQKVFKGGIGLGSWSTGNSFDNLKITSNTTGTVLYENDFSNADSLTADFAPKRYAGGSWADDAMASWTDNWVIEADDGDHGNVLKLNTKSYSGCTVVLTQSVGNADWTNYTLEVDARIDIAGEGWLIFTCVEDDSNYVMWNVGGWTNTQTCFEIISNGTKATQNEKNTDKFEGSSGSKQFDETNGTWYHLKVVVNENLIYTYVDDQLVNTQYIALD